MKIIFDLRKVGLGNNGGSSTLIKSGNILVELGHDVYFVDSMKNKHTWTKLNAKHMICRNPNKLPDGDVIIATGYRSVGPTVSAPERCGSKFHWIRAWETWQYNENAIIKRVLEKPTIKLVNSICLRDKLKKYGYKSFILRPGYDFDLYYSMNLRSKKPIIIGGLYREGVHGRRKRTAWLFEAAKAMKKKYKNVRFWLFGSEHKPFNSIVDNYLRLPSVEKKNEFYNNINIWMAPTMSEGLHLPPAEAMMTGCPVVGTSAELSGIQDYVIHNKTGLISENNLKSFIKNIEILITNEKLRNNISKNTRKKIGELGTRKYNMSKFIEFLEELI
jgi:glycosyltransferase involved in cell wall biosynthesis